MTNENIGEYLRGLRENKGIDIIQISDQTKININVLRKLEANDLQNLPNKAYVRGFVQSYAKAMKADINKALDVLDESYIKLTGENSKGLKSKKAPIKKEPRIPREEDPVKQKVQPPIVKPQGNYAASKNAPIEPSQIEEFLKNLGQILANKRVYIPGLIIMTLVGLISFTYNHMSEKVSQNVASENEEQNTPKAESVNEIKDEKSSLFLLESAKKARDEEVEENNLQEKIAAAQIEENKPAAQVKEPVVEEVEKDEPTSNDMQTIISQMREQGLLVQTPSDLRTERVIKEKTEEMAGNFPFVKFYSFGNRDVFTIAENQEDLNNSEIYPNIVNTASIDNKQNVLVAAVDGDSWLTYKINSKQVKSLILRQGKKLFLQGEQILLYMGNSNVTRIFYNKRKIDFDSRTGVKSLIFPRENAAQYELPLFVANKKGILYTANDYKTLMDEKTEDSE